MRGSSWTRELLRAGAEFVYPRGCLWCGCLLEVNPEIHSFCPACESAIAPRVKNRCQRCSAPVGPHLNTAAGCIHCQSDVYHFERIWSLGSYADMLRTACLKCKQRGQSPLTRGLSELLCRREADAVAAWEPDCVLPVPHHWIDRLWHSEHASDTVASSWGRFLKVPIERHILAKVQWTQKQSRLSSSARRNHLKSAFCVPRTIRLDGLKILLADDIVTTGTTAERATRALRDAGAAGVCVVALARAAGA